MMKAEVKKPFNTHLRRYRAGDTVLSSDDLAPHTFGSLIASESIDQAPAETTFADQRKPRPVK